MINAANERVWVKFHLKTQQGIQNMTDAEAEAVIAKDRESHGRDLYESIERGEFPRWTMSIQVMTEEQANHMPYNPMISPQGLVQRGIPMIESLFFRAQPQP
jgi:catalase